VANLSAGFTLPEAGPTYRSLESFGDGGSEYIVLFDSHETGYAAMSWYCDSCGKELGVDRSNDPATGEPLGCRFCGAGGEALACEYWDNLDESAGTF
jgi:hypothetical protein